MENSSGSEEQNTMDQTEMKQTIGIAVLPSLFAIRLTLRDTSEPYLSYEIEN